jgi:RNA polymerase sigma-70 factor, ECF subfamily
LRRAARLALQSSLMPALDPESLPRHLDRLYRAAWALCGSPHEAEDLVQETFARVLARPRLLRGQDELAYLMTVLRNTFLTDRRTAARRPRASATAIEEIEPVDPRTGDRPEEALQAREVFTAIAGLPERYRLALVAVDVVGLSYREAAHVLETKEATIATRVFRGRQFIVHALERGVQSDAGESPPARAEDEPPAFVEEPPSARGSGLAEPSASPEDSIFGDDPPTPVEEPRPSDSGATDDPLAPVESRATREGEPPPRRLTQRGSA